MKPEEHRRLGCEQAVYRKFKSMQDCSRTCNQYCLVAGIKQHWDDGCVARYVAGTINISTRRLHVLQTVLGVRDTKTIDEIFIAPHLRGEGLDWVGQFGTRVADLKIHKDNRWV